MNKRKRAKGRTEQGKTIATSPTAKRERERERELTDDLKIQKETRV